MKALATSLLTLTALTGGLATLCNEASAVTWDQRLDAFSDRLTLVSPRTEWRAHLSGTLELEGYAFGDHPPGLLRSSGDTLLQPRLTLFLDAQAGPSIYGFAQVRVDRGFDPTDEGLQLRLDEYAIRITPREEGRFNLQVGQFGTIVGQWVNRHLGWSNPFVTAPLFYEQRTGISDREAYPSSRNPDDLGSGNPVIWGPAYTSGVAAAGRWKQLEWAVSWKNAALLSRPGYWPVDVVDFSEPTLSARLGWKPDARWNLGISYSEGAYLGPTTAYPYAASIDRADYTQTLWLADLSYAHRYFQFWAEGTHVRIDAPYLGSLEINAYFLEARYKFTPRLSTALRWNSEYFRGASTPWHREIHRLDLALTWRFNAHSQIQIEVNQYGGDSPHEDPILALRWIVRF